MANISARYPCINFSRTQWVKNNNRPNDSEELKMVLAWPSSHYSNYPWLFFCFHGKSCSSWCHGKFNLFMFYLYIIIIFINLKDICVYVMWGNEWQLQFFLLIAYLKHLQHKFNLEVHFETTCILKYLDTFRVINFSNTLRVSMCGG